MSFIKGQTALFAPIRKSNVATRETLTSSGSTIPTITTAPSTTGKRLAQTSVSSTSSSQRETTGRFERPRSFVPIRKGIESEVPDWWATRTWTACAAGNSGSWSRRSEATAGENKKPKQRLLSSFFSPLLLFLLLSSSFFSIFLFCSFLLLYLRMMTKYFFLLDYVFEVRARVVSLVSQSKKRLKRLKRLKRENRQRKKWSFMAHSWSETEQ